MFRNLSKLRITVFPFQKDERVSFADERVGMCHLRYRKWSGAVRANRRRISLFLSLLSVVEAEAGWDGAADCLDDVVGRFLRLWPLEWWIAVSWGFVSCVRMFCITPIRFGGFLVSFLFFAHPSWSRDCRGKWQGGFPVSESYPGGFGEYKKVNWAFFISPIPVVEGYKSVFTLVFCPYSLYLCGSLCFLEQKMCT